MQLEIAFPDRPPPPISPTDLWEQIDPEARVVALDHDVFGSNRSKDMNVIDSNEIEHDVVRKPVPTFRHHALETLSRLIAQLLAAASAEETCDE